MVLNTLGNLASQSTAEKIVFIPLTILLAIFCFIVSISKNIVGATLWRNVLFYRVQSQRQRRHDFLITLA